MNRETWLNEFAKRVAPYFEKFGYPLPKFRVSIGWTSGGKNSTANGECWHKKASADDHFEIFISPMEAKTEMVAAILVHELTHCAVGFSEGHKGKFAAVLKQFQLAAPWTQSVPTSAFSELIKPIIAEIGDVPHAKLSTAISSSQRIYPGKEPKAPDCGERPEPEPESTRPKTQTTRLRKVSCNLCGYNVRVTQKWLDVGMPHCPMHGAMELDDGQHDDE